jgi:hypothetical protein
MKYIVTIALDDLSQLYVSAIGGGKAILLATGATPAESLRKLSIVMSESPTQMDKISQLSNQ